MQVRVTHAPHQGAHGRRAASAAAAAVAGDGGVGPLHQRVRAPPAAASSVQSAPKPKKQSRPPPGQRVAPCAAASARLGSLVVRAACAWTSSAPSRCPARASTAPCASWGCRAQSQWTCAKSPSPPSCEHGRTAKRLDWTGLDWTGPVSSQRHARLFARANGGLGARQLVRISVGIIRLRSILLL